MYKSSPTLMRSTAPRDSATGQASGKRQHPRWGGGGVTSLRRLIERLGVGAEGFARVRVGIEHMPAAIEQELRARRIADRRQMVEHVAARGVGRHHVAIAVRDEQAERRDE